MQAIEENPDLSRRVEASRSAGAAGSWCVASTVRAPKHMTDHFVRHYLALGCDEFHLFFDDPEFCELDEGLRSDPRLRVYVCDDRYWAGQCTEYPRESAVRAKNIESRQYANYMKVQRETACAWLLNIDVDEIIFPRVDVAELLRGVPRNVFLVALKPFEAVYAEDPREDAVFDTRYFKSLIHPHAEAIAAIYDKSLIPHKYGFWGHNVGKGFYRTDQPLRYLSCHFPKPVNRNLVEKLYTRDIDLLHFESMTFELFLEKRLRRITKKTYARGISDLTKQRLSLFDEVYRKGGEAGARKMYRDMNVFDAERMGVALEDGFVVVRDVGGLASGRRGEGGETLVTAHGRTVAYDQATGFARGMEEEARMAPVKLFREPGSSGMGYLAARAGDGYRYFFVDEKGRLVAYAGGECQLFNVREADEGSVMLSWSGMRVTAEEGGGVVCMAGGNESFGKFAVREA